MAAGRADLAALQPTCGACNAFEADDAPDSDGVVWGYCLEGPGTPIADADGNVATHQPTKACTEWCRRFQPKQ